MQCGSTVPLCPLSARVGLVNALVYIAFLKKDSLVLDSEWHWIFDCPKIFEIRAKHPYLETVIDSINSLRNNREYA